MSRIVRHLWDNWGVDEGGIRSGEVDLYTMNVPLIESLLSPEGMRVCWTRMWRNSYGRLFTEHVVSKPSTSPAGPDSLDSTEEGVIPSGNGSREAHKDLVFKFSPDLRSIIHPDAADVPVGSDAWALSNGWASVTPLRATFAEPPHEIGETPMTLEDVEQKALWKVKL